MPTILRDGPYRYLFSGDGREPPHVHVARDDAVAKFWLHPVRLATGGGFTQREPGRIRALIESRGVMFAEAWDDYFSG